MNDSDGQLPTHSLELITESTPSSESGKVENMKPHRNHLGDFTCRTAVFIAAEKPHFIFTSSEGWGRFYLTDTQIALMVENGSSYIGDLVRANSSK